MMIMDPIIPVALCQPLEPSVLNVTECAELVTLACTMTVDTEPAAGNPANDTVVFPLVVRVWKSPRAILATADVVVPKLTKLPYMLVKNPLLKVLVCKLLTTGAELLKLAVNTELFCRAVISAAA